MRHEDLRLLLERGRHDLDRDVLDNGVEGFEHVAAHVGIDLAGQQKRAVVDLRPALLDLHIEAAGGIGAVGDGLVEAAMFRLREPVRAENEFLQIVLCRCGSGADRQNRNRSKSLFHCPTLLLLSAGRHARLLRKPKQLICHLWNVMSRSGASPRWRYRHCKKNRRDAQISVMDDAR